MFEHILVPLDFSERNKQALDIAVKLAQVGHGRIRLLHIIKQIAGSSFDEFADFYEKLEGEAQEKMEALVADLQNLDVPITMQILVGHRVQEIVNVAAEQQVDLIIMNSHKIDLQNPDEGWGTISYKVGVLAQCPILLVK